jgi:hypothetical protein
MKGKSHETVESITGPCAGVGSVVLVRADSRITANQTTSESGPRCTGCPCCCDCERGDPDCEFQAQPASAIDDTERAEGRRPTPAQRTFAHAYAVEYREAFALFQQRLAGGLALHKALTR